MESQKKVVVGYYRMVAQKCGCSPKYVSMVINDKLGKYSERDTILVKKIHQVSKRLEKLLGSDD